MHTHPTRKFPATQAALVFLASCCVFAEEEARGPTPAEAKAGWRADRFLARPANGDLIHWENLNLQTQTVGAPESIGWDTEVVRIEDTETSSTTRFMRVLAAGP